MAIIQHLFPMSEVPFDRTAGNGPWNNGTKHTSFLERQPRADRPPTPSHSLPPLPPTAPPPYFPPNQSKQNRLPHALQPISTFISADSLPYGSGDASVYPSRRPGNPEVPRQRPLEYPRIPNPDPMILLPRQSVPSAPTDMGPALQNSVLIGGETVATLRDMAELRNKVVAKRLHIKNELRDIEYKRQRTATAQEGFLAASAVHMATLADPALNLPSDQLLQRAWEELKSSTSVVKDREELLKTAEGDLLKLESRLSVKEHDFYARFRMIAQDAMFSADNSTAISSSSDSSVSTIPVARKYYSRVRELNLLRERFFNFVSEHRKQKLVRDAQRKESQVIIPPERVFDEAFLLEKEKMIQGYISAKRDMEEKMETCAQLGVEVAPSNLPAFLDHSNRKERTLRNEAGSNIGKITKLRLPIGTYSGSDNRHSIVQWIYEIQSAKLEAKELGWEESHSPTIGSVAPPIDVSDIPGWTDQDAEDYLALPTYNHPQPSSTSDSSSTETDVPGWAQTGRTVVRLNAEAFQGEQPKRRYSAPTLDLGLHAPARLSRGLLHRKEKDRVNSSQQPHVVRINPESLP